MATKNKLQSKAKGKITKQEGKKLPPKNIHEKDPWCLVERNHSRVMRLGQFADIACSPEITDVEIAVCFADLRGFTNYCHTLQKASRDNCIQMFLKDYFRIYAHAVLLEIWESESDEWDQIEDDPASCSQMEAEIIKILIPVTYKNLGDGVMLVWEIPKATNKAIQGMAMHAILRILFKIYQLFEDNFKQLTPAEIDAYSEHVKKLKIGFGIARGHAWKLNFGHHVKFDYAGSVVNLAARLQDLARPEGIVCQFECSQSVFQKMFNNGLGKIKEVKSMKGFEKQKIFVLNGKDLAEGLNKQPGFSRS